MGRTVMFALVGIVVGVAAARCHVGSRPPSSATAAAVISKDPTATRPPPSSAFGGGPHLVAAKDFPFPDYTGDVQILYTIPAPASK